MGRSSQFREVEIFNCCPLNPATVPLRVRLSVLYSELRDVEDSRVKKKRSEVCISKFQVFIDDSKLLESLSQTSDRSERAFLKDIRKRFVENPNEILREIWTEVDELVNEGFDISTILPMQVISNIWKHKGLGDMQYRFTLSQNEIIKAPSPVPRIVHTCKQFAMEIKSGSGLSSALTSELMMNPNATIFAIWASYNPENGNDLYINQFKCNRYGRIHHELAKHWHVTHGLRLKTCPGTFCLLSINLESTTEHPVSLFDLKKFDAMNDTLWALILASLQTMKTIPITNFSEIFRLVDVDLATTPLSIVSETVSSFCDMAHGEIAQPPTWNKVPK